MTRTIEIPPTNNSTWGFHGTIAAHADAGTAWPLAMTAIADATGCTPDEVHAFLDSRYGRHFADDVLNGLTEHQPLADAIAAAIAAATRKWMGWTVGRAAARENGIPRGLPYLSGLVIHAAIEADAVG